MQIVLLTLHKKEFAGSRHYP